MIHDIFLGFLAGLVSSISFGPAFFAITETSLKNGFLSGAMVAIGVSLSDILYITLILTGYLTWFTGDEHQTIFSLVGGVVLLGYGVRYLLKKVTLQESSFKPVLKGTTLIQSFLKGFAVNTVNPYVAIYWVGVVAFSSTQLTLISNNGLILYFASALVTLVSVDIMKSYLAATLRSRIRGYVHIVFCLIGVLFILFGLKLLFDSLNPELS